MHATALRWAALVCSAIVAVAAEGCSDDAGTNSSSTSRGASSSSSTSSSGGEGGQGGAGGAGGGSVTDTGHSGAEIVTAGDTAKSPSYTMVFTFGQPTQNQGKTTSPSYSLRGGLAGANGSAP